RRFRPVRPVRRLRRHALHPLFHPQALAPLPLREREGPAAKLWEGEGVTYETGTPPHPARAARESTLSRTGRGASSPALHPRAPLASGAAIPWGRRGANLQPRPVFSWGHFPFLELFARGDIRRH